ncbi:MAG: DUF4386 domain-containing protein [Saprospiraceae bacterium]|nr:DUF4386 domain-containing protein [Saprospiraceae bacterium]
MQQIDSNRKNEKITGAFFIAATTTAIIGSNLYDPVLKNTDVLSAARNASSNIALGAFFELILACSNIGTGIMLYPHLKKYSEIWGLGYALFRLLEVVFILIGVVSMLTIVKLSHESATLSGHGLSSLQASGNVLKTIYSWAFILGPHFMLGINTFIYSSIFYQAKLLPGKLSLVGIFGAVLIFTAALLELFGAIPHFSAQIIFLALPIAIYEMVLAGWLIIKGFNKAVYEPV